MHTEALLSTNLFRRACVLGIVLFGAIIATNAEALPEPKVTITYSLETTDGGAYRQKLSDTPLGLGDADYVFDVVDSGDTAVTVYVASPLEDAMTVFRRDAGTGMLTVVDTLQSGSPGAEWLAHMISPVISPDGRQIYVDCYAKNSLAVFDRDPVTGHLTFAQEST